MPNWCDTSYVIEGPEEDLLCIENAICDVISGRYPKQEGSSQEWEGNVLHALRIPTVDKDDRIHGSFRGFIHCMPERVCGRLHFSADEAWARTDFAEALKIRFKNIRVYWSAEEPGCGYYVTNDENFTFFSRYLVETYDDSEYYDTLDEVFKALEQYGCKTMEDVQRHNDECEDCDDWITIHEFEVDTEDRSFGDIPLLPEPDKNLF